VFGDKTRQYYANAPIVTSVTHDPANILAGAVNEETITVTGAVTGGRVIVSAPSLEANVVLSNEIVSAADTVKFRLFNPTGGAINPASQSFLVTIFPAA